MIDWTILLSFNKYTGLFEWVLPAIETEFLLVGSILSKARVGAEEDKTANIVKKTNK